MLLIIGFNHKSAPLGLREKLSVPEKQAHITQLVNQEAGELLILNTCNRTEFMTTLPYHDLLNNGLHQEFGNEWVSFCYVYQKQDAITHLMRVAVGIDSMVLGESQIFGQLKKAYQQATASGNIGTYLGYLCPFVFKSAKKIRAQTEINTNSLSIAYAAISLAKNIFSDLSQSQILLIGAGEVITLVAQYVRDIPVKTLFVANRTLANSETLAKKFNAQAIALDAIEHQLNTVDIVISCTASPHPIITKNLLEPVMRKRKHRPIFMVDLAVPRDIEAEVSTLADIYLYNIDDLHEIVQKNRAHRERAAVQAEEIIQTELQHFLDWQNTLAAIPIICRYREQMTQIRDAEVAKAINALTNHKPADEVIKRLAHDLTQKMIHTPTVAIRHASYQENTHLLEWAQKLLGLKANDPKQEE
jgi:glutamyl-tRNA reductase